MKKINISVNVFGIEQKIQTFNGRTCFTNELFPLKVCDDQKQDHHDLLLVSNEHNSHYVVISNFDQFVRPYVTANNVPARVCKRCITHFNTCRYKSADEKWRQHLELCKSFEHVRCILPKKESICFNNFEFSKKIRFVIYADF